MKFALCNEMFEETPFPEVCAAASRLGYHGVEIAPFTLTGSACDFTAEQRHETRKTAEDHGLEVVGLHWLYAGQKDMHVNSPDHVLWGNARDYLEALVDMCADIGGRILVIGSPKQRTLSTGQSYEDAWQRARDLFGSVLGSAEEREVALCLEPLSTAETDFINTVDEGLRMVRELAHPWFKLHLDVKAMFAEGKAVEDIILSSDVSDIGHFHVNDPNLYGPGMGDLDYGPIAEAIKGIGWDEWLSVEVFKYDPDPETIARRSIEYLKKFW